MGDKCNHQSCWYVCFEKETFTAGKALKKAKKKKAPKFISAISHEEKKRMVKDAPNAYNRY